MKKLIELLLDPNPELDESHSATRYMEADMTRREWKHERRRARPKHFVPVLGIIAIIALLVLAVVGV